MMYFGPVAFIYNKSIVLYCCTKNNYSVSCPKTYGQIMMYFGPVAFIYNKSIVLYCCTKNNYSVSCPKTYGQTRRSVKVKVTRH